MGADWGLYSALRGQDNWAQKRQDKMQNLMILERREQKAQGELEKQMQLEQGMQNYFDEISKIDALAEDQGRIQEKEKEARRNIYKGIAAVNGNLKSYMSTGGLSALSEYKRDIMGSDAVKNAALNKVNMSNFIKDKSEGKYVRNVEVEVPIMESDGVTPKIVNGEVVTEKQTVSMEKQAQMFKDGIITKLSYNGAERKVKLDPLKFSKTTKNPNDPYTSYAVTTDDMYNYAIEQGASEEYAKKIAVEYGKSAIKTKQPWRWGKEDQYADAANAAKAAKYSRGSSGGSTGTMKLNQTGPELDRNSMAAIQSGEDKSVPMGEYDMDFFSKSLGIKYDSSNGSYRPTKTLNAVDRDTRKPLEVKNARQLSLVEYVTGADGQTYILADAIYDADEPIQDNPHKENWFGGNGLVDDESRNNWQFTNATAGETGMEQGDDLVSGQVLINITKQMSNQRFRDQLNRAMGITDKFEGAAASANEMDQNNAMGSTYSSIVRGLMAKDKSLSLEEAQAIASQGIQK